LIGLWREANEIISYSSYMELVSTVSLVFDLYNFYVERKQNNNNNNNNKQTNKQKSKILQFLWS